MSGCRRLRKDKRHAHHRRWNSNCGSSQVVDARGSVYGGVHAPARPHDRERGAPGHRARIRRVVATGVCFLPLTCAIFVAAGIAGRLTSRVPSRLLITPGFLLIGAGLLLMRGLTPNSGWTHLLAGMIVAGIGGGLVSTPLVSTAVGVVEPARAGMASGINTTLRQVGVATGVAALGTILASRERSSVLSGLNGTALAGHAHAIAHAVSTGGTAQTIATTPAPLQGLVATTARSAFVDGLNAILLISAIVAFAASVFSLVLIRERDFVTLEEGEEPTESTELAVAA